MKHWHGAKADSWFSHIAVEVPGEETGNEWLEPVDDESYFNLQSKRKEFCFMMNSYRTTDPEFMERFEHFAFDEAVNEPGQELEPVTRHMAILAALLGCQGIDAFREELPDALNAGVTPVMVKEIVYQAVDYLGIGRVLPFLEAANEILTQRGVSLPWRARPQPRWKIGWKKEHRPRRISSALRCWRPGRPVISTAGWRPTALGITIPAPALLSLSGK